MQNQETSITIRAVDKASYAVLSVAANLETLSKKMAKTSQLGYAMGQLGQQLAPLQNRLIDIGSKWGAAGRRIGGVSVVVGGAVAGLVGFAKSAADAGDQVSDLSARYLVGGDLIQLYGKLVKESGGSFDDAATSIGKLNKATNEAIHEGGESAAAFAGIGISIKELKTLKADELLIRMANAFKGSEKDREKQAVLLKLMGKNGTVFMQTMNLGGERIKKTYAEMNKNGEILNKKQLTIAASFSDSWDRMAGTLDGVKNRIGISLAGTLEPQLKRFQTWLSGTGGKEIELQFARIFTNENIGILVEGLEGVWHAVKAVGKAFKWMVTTVGPNATAFIGLGIVLAPIGGALFSTARGVWDLGRGLIFLGGTIPGVATGLASIGSAARIAGGGVQAFGIAALARLGPVSIVLAAIYASYKAIQAFQRLGDTQDANAKDNGVRQDKRAAYNNTLRSVGGDKFVNAFGPNTDFQQLNTVISGLERGGQVAPGTAARLAALPVDVSGLMKVEISTTAGATARVTEIKKYGALDFEASIGMLMAGG